MKTFRQRLRSGEFLVGTFLKTPNGRTTEILGQLGLDFVVVDQEHAPFDRKHIDNIMLAAKAVGVPALVRVATPDTILSSLDCGATGIIVPHVSTPSYAREVADACRYRGGHRGFATSTRAGRYGISAMRDHVRAADSDTVLIAQIEDPAAIAHVDEIANISDIDSLFIGRGDLTAALEQESAAAPAVEEAVRKIAAASHAAGKAVTLFVRTPSEIKTLRYVGASVFVLSSDLGFMRDSASEAIKASKEAMMAKGQ